MSVGWPDVFGVLGVLLVVGAFLLLQTNRIAPSNPYFSLANATGALLILISLMFDFNLPAFIIEFFWLLISVLGFWSNRGKYESRSDRMTSRRAH